MAISILDSQGTLVYILIDDSGTQATADILVLLVLN